MNKGHMKQFVVTVSPLENNAVESSLFSSIGFSYPSQKQLVLFFYVLHQVENYVCGSRGHSC